MTAKPGSRNPYRPGAAVSPLHLAGRAKELQRFVAAVKAAPELPANIRLTGLRGVGKTVLLKEFEKVARDDLGWVTSRIQVEPRHNREEALAELVIGLADQAKNQASRTARLRVKVAGVVAAARGLIKVSYEDLEFSLSPSTGEKHKTIVKALFDAALAADDNGASSYLLMLDEAQVLRDDKDRDSEHPLSLLVAAINSLQEAEVPVGLVLCGLPTLRANLMKARTYSERMFRGEEIGRLAADDAREAFVKPLEGSGVVAAEDLVDRVVTEVEGYPFFIQLWGAELWDAAAIVGAATLEVGLLDQVEPDIYQRLDRDFYEGRVESLTPAEQDLLMATAACSYPPLRTADIRGQSPKTEGNVNVLMGRLADQGVVFRVQKGLYEYTAPKFHDYLQRRRQRLAERGH